MTRHLRLALLPYCHDKRSPEYVAHMDVPPADLSIAAGELIRALAQDPVTWTSSRAGTYLEAEVLRWFSDLAFPGVPGAAGVACSGGTQANLLAILWARNLALGRLGCDVNRLGLADALRRSGTRSLKVLASETAHGSIAMAVRHAGLGDEGLVRLPVDDRDAVRLDALEEALGTAQRAGDRVALVVLAAGTVGVGAIDPLAEAVALAHRHGARVHVDAAHGGMLLFSRRHAAKLAGLEQADSVTADPHKILGLNQGLGALLCRDGADRDAAAKDRAPYFLAPLGAPETWRHALDGTRPLNALGAWILLRHLGRDGYGRIVDHLLDLAERFADGIGRHEGLELFATPEMNLVCFRPRGAGDAEVERAADAIARRRHRVSRYRSRRGDFLRAVFVNPATTPAHVDALVRSAAAVAR